MPKDWLLYNRVGATIANSGNSELALEYYNRALELNPFYIRARLVLPDDLVTLAHLSRRYNLGISCINLRVSNGM